MTLELNLRETLCVWLLTKHPLRVRLLQTYANPIWEGVTGR